MLCDQYTDPAYALLYHLLQERPDAADFVKSAELDDQRVNELPDSMFAWPARRLFPIDTPENTVLSTMYREKCAAVPTEVDDRLQKARDIYNVNPVLGKRQVKTASQTEDTVREHVLLPAHGRLRVRTPDDVKVAEELLLAQYPRLSIEDRAEGFTNLVKVAQEMKVPLKPATMRMAGMTVCTTKVAQDFIEARRCATKEPLFQRAYEKLASAMSGRGEQIRNRDELVALCDAVAQLDKRAGLESFYDKHLPDPIRTVFNTEKVAEESVDLAGRSVALSKLASMPDTFWEDVIGLDLSRELMDKTGAVDLEKVRQIIPTLPLDLKLVLKNQVP